MCSGLGGFELSGDDLEPAIPEGGIGEVDTDDGAEVFGGHRTAGGEQLEVLRYERFAMQLVLRLHAQREQLTVRIGIDVPG